MFEPITVKPDYYQPSPQMDSWTNFGPGESLQDPLEPAKQRALINDQFETVAPDSDDNFLETEDISVEEAQTEGIAKPVTNQPDTVIVDPEVALNDPDLMEEETVTDSHNPGKMQSDQVKSDPGISDDVKINKDPRNEYDSSKTELTPVAPTNASELPKDTPISLL